MKTNLNTKKKPDTKSPERKRMLPRPETLNYNLWDVLMCKSLLIIRELTNKGSIGKRRLLCQLRI